MLITLYTPVGIVYQKFNINETDIIYGDLIKYINLPKHELYDELDRSVIIRNKVFIKTIINLFSYNEINSKEIKLNDEINCDINEFTILFSYEYYIKNCNHKYIKIENNIKNGNNNDAINDQWKIIFIDSDCENYEEICKLAVKNNGLSLQCINPDLMTNEICKLAVMQNGFALAYVKNELMTNEICKLAVRQNGYALEIVKPELMTDEICKLAVQQNGWSLKYVKEQTDEICKLAVMENGFYALRHVKEQTDEICKLAVQRDGYALYYVKKQTDEICKLAVQKYGSALKYVKEQTEEICKLAVQKDVDALKYVKQELMTDEIRKLACIHDDYA